MSRGRGVVAGCALGATSGWNFGNLGGIASELADANGVGLATIGLLSTAMVMTHLAIQIPGGKASDRFGPARSGALALVVLMAGNALALAAPAGGLALAIVPQLEEVLGWRAPYWTALALGLVVLAAVLALGVGVRPMGLTLTADGGLTPQAERPAGVVGDRSLYRVAVLYSASYGIGVVLANWVVELLQRHSDMSDGAAAAAGALTLLLVVVSRPLGGWILLAHPSMARAAVVARLVVGPR